MAKFKVHFEASAAIGIEIEVEADNREDAEEVGQRWFNLAGNQSALETAADEIFNAPDQTVKAYAEITKLPITYMTMELDECGFEIVDTFE
jgi:hypothetical protein